MVCIHGDSVCRNYFPFVKMHLDKMMKQNLCKARKNNNKYGMNSKLKNENICCWTAAATENKQKMNILSSVPVPQHLQIISFQFGDWFEMTKQWTHMCSFLKICSSNMTAILISYDAFYSDLYTMRRRRIQMINIGLNFFLIRFCTDHGNI